MITHRRETYQPTSIFWDGIGLRNFARTMGFVNIEILKSLLMSKLYEVVWRPSMNLEITSSQAGHSPRDSSPNYGFHPYYHLVNVYKERMGKIHHFFMGKFTMFMVIFHSYVELPEGTSEILQFGSQELCVWLATVSHICVDHTNVTNTNKYVYPMNIGYDDMMGLYTYIYIRECLLLTIKYIPFYSIYIYMCVCVSSDSYTSICASITMKGIILLPLVITVSPHCSHVQHTHTHQILCFLKRCVLLVVVSSCVASLAATDPP